jgi:hypothetical protein
MKKFYAPLIALVLFASCIGYKELPVEYDYSYKGNFKKYRTFDIMRSTVATDSSMSNTVIEKSILSRMKFLGYKQSETKPHLLVCYKMFPDSLTFNGYSQPEIEQWIAHQDTNLDYDPKKLDLKTGTLLIQFFDRRQNRSIWQGYSTALYGSINFEDNRNLRNAVISILDKYRFWAEGFMEGAGTNPTEMSNEP